MLIRGLDFDVFCRNRSRLRTIICSVLLGIAQFETFKEGTPICLYRLRVLTPLIILLIQKTGIEAR